MEVIRFDKDAIPVNCIVKIGFTNRAYQDLCKYSINPEECIASLSKSTRLIITSRDDDEMFSIITPYGNFFCGMNQKTGDGFSVVTYRENDLHSQNTALKRGIIFAINNGIDVEVLLPTLDIHYRYLSGEKYDYNAMDCGDTKPSADVIATAIQQTKKKKSFSYTGSEPEDTTDSIYEEDYEDLYLKEVLKQSEQYSILASELDEKKTHEMGQMSYSEFMATDYDRIDRIAYAFIVDDVDKSVFKPGVQVEFQGRHSERINGEIVEVDTSDSERKKIVVLFNTQISIDLFQPFGWISLSFSTVNKDVQLAANSRIVDGSAKATYMRHVIGGNKTSGFDNKDLSDVVEKLNAKKYPPNASQMRAIERGINSKDIFLVMGPPGTGKTTVILEWVKYFVGVEHKRVLVSSQNNKAVDNVLARLAEEKDIDVIRIGSEAKLQQEVIPYMFENKLITLNKKIDEATKNKSELLKKSIQEWKEYKESFLPLLHQLREFDEQVQRGNESICDQLIPIRKRMKKIYEEYMAAIAVNKSAIRKLKELNQAIEEYENKNFILKKLLEKKHKEDLLKIDELTIEKKQSRIKASELAAKYNEYAERYESQVFILRDRFVSDIKHVKRNSIKISRGYIDNIPRCPNIAGLFEAIRISNLLLQSPISIREILKQIDSEIVRAESILDIEESWRENIVGKQNYALNEVVLETVDLVGATCIGVSSQKRFANLQFDVTIIDEAGQIQIHNALVPMSVSNKLIMLGDYKQIPPSADQELLDLCELNGVDTELLEKSLFEKLFVDLPDSNKMMLDTQYRMPGEIADIISEWFYNGEYKSPPFKRNLVSMLPELSPKPLLIIDTSSHRERYEMRTPERGTYNVLEAEICNKILKYIEANDVNIPQNEIGIISAYGDQVARIKKAISKTVSAERANAMVATLDSFQGQERDLILYSFTKSSKKKPTMSRIGFLNELRRLNVAMSRCKKTLIMIGDMTFLSGCLYQDTDDDGNSIYEHSEKEFSDFISKMLQDIRAGRGEVISYESFEERLKA